MKLLKFGAALIEAVGEAAVEQEETNKLKRSMADRRR